jgi:inner membrane protein
VLYRVDGNEPGGETCVWFAELRHVLPGLPPSFRYGACRDEASRAGWRPHRLRYFSVDERQAL